MKAEEIFKIAMAMIDEMSSTGELDETSVADYRGKAPYILTMLQNEIFGIENRYKEAEDKIIPIPIENLNQTVQVDNIKAATLLTNGLAAQLMLSEDKALASYFNQRYEEFRASLISRAPGKRRKIEDVYDASLNY